MMKRMDGSGCRIVCCRRFLPSALLLVGWLVGVGSTLAETSQDKSEFAGTVEQIRALRDQIAGLLATLPPEVRRDLTAELRFETTIPAPDLPKSDPEPVAPSVAPLPTEPAPSVPPPAERLPSPPSPEPGRAEVEPVSPSAPPLPNAPPAPVPPATDPTASGSPQATGEVPPPAARSATSRRSRRCEFLAALDTNDDGQIDALDRYWRYLFVWRDRNGDGTAQESEIRSAYEAGVRTLTTDADTFTRKKGSLGEMRQIDGEIWLDLRGDGFAAGRDDGVLMVDATALARRGGPELLSASGQRLAGMEPVLRGMEIRPDGGPAQRLDCP